MEQIRIVKSNSLYELFVKLKGTMISFNRIVKVDMIQVYNKQTMLLLRTSCNVQYCHKEKIYQL